MLSAARSRFIGIIEAKTGIQKPVVPLPGRLQFIDDQQIDFQVAISDDRYLTVFQCDSRIIGGNRRAFAGKQLQ